MTAKNELLESLLKQADNPYVFIPTERQRELWDIVRQNAQPDKLTLIGYGGAAGGGKTRAIVELAIDLSLSFPGNRILVGRKDFKDLSSTVMESFFRHCPPQLIVGRNSVEHWVKLREKSWPKGVVSVVRFRELKDWMGLGSEEYGAVLIDEAAEVSRDSVLMLLSRLRWRLPPEIEGKGVRNSYYLIAASNPYPTWFKEWFVERRLPEELLAQSGATIHFVPALAKDNPHLPANYESFLRAALPPQWVKRFMDGSWDVFIGQVYPQFNPEIHEWNRRLPNGDLFIPQFERIVGGLDFGEPSNSGHKTCGMVGGVTESGRLIRLDCFESASADVYERLVEWMARMEEKWLPYVKTRKNSFADYAIEEPVNQRIVWCADKSQMGWIQEMRKAFIIRPSQGGSGSVRWGIGLVSNRLNVDHSGIPGSFYLPHMENFKEAMIRYRWPERDELERPPSTPLKIDDDLVDADRYMHELLPVTLGPPEQFMQQIPRVKNEYTGSDEDAQFARLFGPSIHTRRSEPSDFSSALFDEELKIF